MRRVREVSPTSPVSGWAAPASSPSSCHRGHLPLGASLSFETPRTLSAPNSMPFACVISQLQAAFPQRSAFGCRFGLDHVAVACRCGGTPPRAKPELTNLLSLTSFTPSHLSHLGSHPVVPLGNISIRSSLLQLASFDGTSFHDVTPFDCPTHSRGVSPEQPTAEFVLIRRL